MNNSPIFIFSIPLMIYKSQSHLLLQALNAIPHF